MDALVFMKKGSMPVYKQVDDPIAGKGQALVRLNAAALNHRDIWIIQGKYPGIREGVVMGSDGTGTLDGIQYLINPNLHWGKRQDFAGPNYQILGMPSDGTFAEWITVERDRLVEKPDHLNDEEAAALPLGGLTAYRVLFKRCKLRSNDRICISGIGGGVALLAFQFALAIGSEVWVTSSNPEKLEAARKMGATGGYLYNEPDWMKSMKKESGGFDVIIDSAAGNGFQALTSMAKPGARIGIYGGTRGLIQNLSPQQIFWNQLNILGSTMGSDSDFKEMVHFVALHKIHPRVDSKYPLAQADPAFARMESGKQFGKIILQISS